MCVCMGGGVSEIYIHIHIHMHIHIHIYNTICPWTDSPHTIWNRIFKLHSMKWKFGFYGNSVVSCVFSGNCLMRGLVIFFLEAVFLRRYFAEADM